MQFNGAEVVEAAGQSVREMRQKRLTTVIQRPYQMFQLKDLGEEEQAQSPELKEIKRKFERLELQVQLEVHAKELLEQKMKNV